MSSTSTSNILKKLNTVQRELPAVIESVKEVAIPAVEIGAEVATHLSFEALSAVTGVPPLRELGFFAAPAAGKFAAAATGLALDGMGKMGVLAIDGIKEVVNVADKAIKHETKQTPYRMSLRPAD